ncbi:unnamed protein product [Macrosiphum euphorbiae]|uniref:RNA-directed DNA polymerase n=1 Tax=Macrosiphum euphorbiae TaxID=13131 RepID=A0AAV0XYM3_9HEMI|nr:unnamed protein product [Macrosiphum euphorbiae]
MFFTFDKNPKRAAIQLQYQLNLATTWFHRWKIKINPTKTVGILFGRSNTTHIPPLLLDNHPVTWSNHAKYLGVTIGRKLTFDKHVQDIPKKATRVLGILYPILNRSSPVPKSSKLNILKLYVSPILSYAGPSWAPFIGPSHWKSIESVQNIGIRTITGMPTIVKNSVLLKSANFKSIKNSIHSQSKSMFYKNSFSIHAHIRLLGKSHTPPTTKRRIKPYPLTWVDQQI